MTTSGIAVPQPASPASFQASNSSNTRTPVIYPFLEERDDAWRAQIQSPLFSLSPEFHAEIGSHLAPDASGKNWEGRAVLGITMHSVAQTCQAGYMLAMRLPINLTKQQRQFHANSQMRLATDYFHFHAPARPGQRGHTLAALKFVATFIHVQAPDAQFNLNLGARGNLEALLQDHNFLDGLPSVRYSMASTLVPALVAALKHQASLPLERRSNFEIVLNQLALNDLRFSIDEFKLLKEAVQQHEKAVIVQGDYAALPDNLPILLRNNLMEKIRIDPPLNRINRPQLNSKFLETASALAGNTSVKEIDLNVSDSDHVQALLTALKTSKVESVTLRHDPLNPIRQPGAALIDFVNSYKQLKTLRVCFSRIPGKPSGLTKENFDAWETFKTKTCGHLQEVYVELPAISRDTSAT